MGLPRNRRVVWPDRIEENMRLIRNSLPAGTKALAVVKADGYGHGAATTARAALAGGADMLAVACVGEGTALRKDGIIAPILVLGAVTAEDAGEGIDSGLIQTICSPEMAAIIENEAAARGIQAEVHLKFDTGMGRIGVRTAKERDDVLEAIGNAPHVRLTGAFTHFSDADGGPEGMEYTDEQYRKFRELTDVLPPCVIRHCANSATIHRRPEYGMDMVRAGISLYGYPPVETDLPLRPCMEWTAKVSYVKELPAGAYVSYGRTYRTDGPVRAATITCGYADGYHRAAGSRAEVIIRGRRARIIGRICMDQMMADVTHIPDVQPEDEVILMGGEGESRITAEDIAGWSGTISYEILLSVGSRVERLTETAERKEQA